MTEAGRAKFAPGRLHEFFDHTGDIGIRLAAPSLAGVYEAAVEALCETLTDPAAVEPGRVEPLRLGPQPADLLLADLLGELVYLFETRAFLPRRADVRVEGEGEAIVLAADVAGEPYDPARHQIKVLIKAVTFHRLEVVRDDDGWRATVVLDI